MSIYECLSAEEREMMENYIYLYGGTCTSVNIEASLREWAESKEELFHMFGDELILERPIDIECSAHEMERRFAKQFESRDNIFQSFKNDLLSALHMQGYINDHGYGSEYYNVTSLFCATALSSNKLYGDGFTIANIRITDGMKVTKALHKLAKLVNLEEKYEEFRLAHSMILNDKRTRGTLCLSIHPMDFMTMSDNTYNWESCMSWVSNGGYRAGTIEMMNSPCVVVAYLRGDTPFSFERYNWQGNKKWRTLCICNHEVIAAIKGYPYAQNGLTNICVDWLRDLYNTNICSIFNTPSFIYEESNENNVLEAFPHLKTNDELSISFEVNAMYNDFFAYHTHHLMYLSDCWKDSAELQFPAQLNNYNITINYSGALTCMCCGRVYDQDYDGEDHLCCENCREDDEEYFYCSYCNERMSYDYDNYYEMDDGTILCDDCFANHGFEDIVLGGYYYNDESELIYLTPIDDIVDGESEELKEILPYMVVHKDAAYMLSQVPVARPRAWARSYPQCHITKDNRYYYNWNDVSLAYLQSWFELYSETQKELGYWLEEYIKYLAEYKAD